MLNDEEKIRYKRQIALDNWGIEIQERLKNTTVFVAGAGGSGSPIITQLALLGVGCIKICDYDTVELSNLNRQFLHCVSETTRIGMNKAISASKTVYNINHNVRVEVYEEKITDDNIDDLVGNSEIIFDSVDKIDVKFILSRCSIRKRIPHLFYGMMDINSFAAIFFPPKTPCFHCIFDVNKVNDLNYIMNMDSESKRTMTPVCCSPVVMSAGFIVTEALKVLYGIGEPAYNKFYLFLQKGSNKIAKSTGYLGMKYWISDHFKEISLEQGFDWDLGWRGNTIEELTISLNKQCKYCSDSYTKEVSPIDIEINFNF